MTTCTMYLKPKQKKTNNYLYLKPKDWIHDFLEVLEQILNSLHLPEEDVQLEPHLDLHRDGGPRLHPEAGVVLFRIGHHSVLELLEIAGVGLVEVRSGHKGR